MNPNETTKKILSDINSGELIILNTLSINHEFGITETGPTDYSFLTLKLKVISKKKLEKNRK